MVSLSASKCKVYPRVSDYAMVDDMPLFDFAKAVLHRTRQLG